MQRDFWDYLQDPRKEMREEIEAKFDPENIQ